MPTAGLNLGRHSIKLGLDYRRILAIRRDPTGSINLIDESADTITLLQDWWSAHADPVNANAAVQEFSLWLQDTWQVSSRLTVAAGLRWEFSPAPTVFANFLDTASNGLVARTQPLWPTSYHDYAPRLGVAWRLTKDGRTVLRAGGGVLRKVIDRLQTRFVEVADPRIFTNVNTPADYEALVESIRREQK